MKSQRIILILLFGLFLSCRKDKTDLRYMECYSEITSASELHFKEDAIAFGIERLAADSLSDFLHNPIYSQEESIYALGKLSAIYNAASDTNSPLYDPIFKYQIHKEFGYSTIRLAVQFENEQEQQDFVYHPENTNNEVLRYMMDEKGFFVGGEITIGPFPWVVMESSQEYVQELFVKQLMESPGIDSAFVGRYHINYDNDIIYSWTDEYDEFIFELGMGDCPLGCTEFHYWQVRVDHDCNVTYIGEYGAPLPG